ncbi:hypothetical protein GCK32_013387 [Trichostrongylus colubriformis]|uniref:Uncharacterized protein n=1 Tax=Trichostrongylus colubriformis TaxID=6319 RepID=A0AAN8IPQ7_TRICO
MPFLQGSRTRVLHHSRFKHTHSEPKIVMRDKPPAISDHDVTNRILGLNFKSNDFEVLEQIQMEGKADQIWSTVKQNPDNEDLANYVAEFKNIQRRLSQAMEAVENNNMKRLRKVIDHDVVKARNAKGLKSHKSCSSIHQIP